MRSPSGVPPGMGQQIEISAQLSQPLTSIIWGIIFETSLVQMKQQNSVENGSKGGDSKEVDFLHQNCFLVCLLIQKQNFVEIPL